MKKIIHIIIAIMVIQLLLNAAALGCYTPITMTVNSYVDGSPVDGFAVTVSPADIYHRANGNTTFTRDYYYGANVALTVGDASIYAFKQWQVDGLPVTDNASVSVQITANKTATLCYITDADHLPAKPVLTSPPNGSTCGRSVQLRWQSSGSGLTYYVYRGTSENGSLTFLGTTTDTYWNVTNLDFDSTYYWEVKYYKTNYGFSAMSDRWYFNTKNVLYVNKDATGANNGTTWADGYTSIQLAVDAAEPSCEIWVKKGAYNLTSQVNINKIVALYGGFNGDETSRGQRDWRNNITITDGQDSVRSFYLTANCTIDGFTIRNGRAINGGGIDCTNSNPTISNCVIRDNTADGTYGSGGGIRNYLNASPTITNCVFYNNYAVDSGGGVANTGEKRNTNHGCYSIIKNCLFAHNSTAKGGGAMCNHYGSDSTIVNCTFYSNHASLGGAIYNDLADPRITNGILWANDASTRGDQIDDYWDGGSIVTYSDVQGGWSGSTNKNVNPQFASTSDLDGPDNIFMTPDDGLRLTSPVSDNLCIDHGNNSAISLSTDIAGQTRKVDDTSVTDGGSPANDVPYVDMGAYEYQP